MPGPVVVEVVNEWVERRVGKLMVGGCVSNYMGEKMGGRVNDELEELVDK